MRRRQLRIYTKDERPLFVGVKRVSIPMIRNGKKYMACRQQYRLFLRIGDRAPVERWKEGIVIQKQAVALLAHCGLVRFGRITE